MDILTVYTTIRYTRQCVPKQSRHTLKKSRDTKHHTLSSTNNLCRSGAAGLSDSSKYVTQNEQNEVARDHRRDSEAIHVL